MPLGHLGINVPDLPKAQAYYDQVMPLVGYEAFFATDEEFAYRPAEGKPGTFVFFYPAKAGADFSRDQPGLRHLAFILPTRNAVERVHQQVRSLGDTVLHEPQEFPRYHPGY